MGMEKYIRVKVLGTGSFGSAILVTKVGTREQYVVKEIDVSKMSSPERKAAEQEAKVLASLAHPNIVTAVESFVEKGKLCIVMDYCAGGDLHQLVQRQRGRLMEEDRVLDMFVQMCLAMKHVHDRKILHRDLKGQNVFMAAGGRMLKIGDFGVAKVLEGTMQLAQTAVGTPYYLSPEICQGKPYNHKSDVWSLGCILYELCTLKHAFDAQSLKLLVLKIVRGNYPPVHKSYSADLRGLVDAMIQKDPRKRPSVNDILGMPLLQQRINGFLSQEKLSDEFSHTVIHGRRGLTPPTAKEKLVSAQSAAGNAHASKRPAAGPLPSGGGGRVAGAGEGAGPTPPALRPSQRASAAATNAVDEARQRALQQMERREREEKEERAKHMAELRRQREEASKHAREEAARRAHQAKAEQMREEAKRAQEKQRLQQLQLQQQQEQLLMQRQRQEEEARRAQEARLAQRREFAQRRAELARNRERAQEDGDDASVHVFVPSRDTRGQDHTGREAGAAPHRAKPSNDERAQAYWEMREAARRNRMAAEGAARAAQPRHHEPEQEDLQLQTYMEEEAPSRGGSNPGPQKGGMQSEANMAELRRQAYLDMRAAAERNKRLIMGEVAEMNETYTEDHDEQAQEHEEEEEEWNEEREQDLYTIAERESGEFSEMVDNMRTVMIESSSDENSLPRTLEEVAEDHEQQENNVRLEPQYSGKFLLDGRTLELPGLKGLANSMEASLAHRVEALREYLEDELGDDAFIKAYRRMEALKDNDRHEDEEENAVQSICEELGPGKEGYVSLIHQLLVCEDAMHDENR